jgi:phosphoglycerate dehydrogenase-like enzyme
MTSSSSAAAPTPSRSIHPPALPSTERIIGAAELGAMKNDCVFVNTSRGACVDEGALVEELGKGRLFAFLDVTDPEPAADDSPLRTLPNVVLTSHMAGGRDFRLGRQAVDDIAAFLSGGEPVMSVTGDMLDRIA